jgi:hypothetical protein
MAMRSSGVYSDGARVSHRRRYRLTVTTILQCQQEAPKSNKRIGCRNNKWENDLRQLDKARAAIWECAEVTEWQVVTDDGTNVDAALLHVISVWKRLPPHIRETILTLVFAADVAPEHLQ